MTPYKQLNRHNPEQGIYGDCHRTAIACLLDLPPIEIPNWAESYWDDTTAWDKATREFLATHNMSIASIAYSGEGGLDGVLKCLLYTSPNLYYMITGTSKNGVHHVVIGADGRIIWDPAQDDSGIVGPCSDGYYWVEILIPLSMVYIKEG